MSMNFATPDEDDHIEHCINIAMQSGNGLFKEIGAEKLRETICRMIEILKDAGAMLPDGTLSEAEMNDLIEHNKHDEQFVASARIMEEVQKAVEAFEAASERYDPSPEDLAWASEVVGRCREKGIGVLMTELGAYIINVREKTITLRIRNPYSFDVKNQVKMTSLFDKLGFKMIDAAISKT